LYCVVFANQTFEPNLKTKKKPKKRANKNPKKNEKRKHFVKGLKQAVASFLTKKILPECGDNKKLIP
jgi:hypothetical protein